MGGHAKRKRKVAVATTNEEKENELDIAAPTEPAYNNGPMYKIMSHAQTSEALHKKYIKDLQQLYTKMDNNAFVVTFIQMLKAAMACDESNEYAMTSLQFCAKFVASFDNKDTHPVLESTFEWLLETISSNPHIRFRLCQFINLVLEALGNDASLDDVICDKILEYMVDRLLDCSPNVRVQAIYALQRLQMPDNPDDAVVRAYQYHLSADPSPRVRIAALICLGRNSITVPYILDRLFDIDDKVRRHTYMQMSSFPVRSYTVAQRQLLLERGLNDRCEAVRKVASKIMLQQWFESYNKNLIALCDALKLDATEDEIERFRKIAKQMLLEIFRREDASFLVEHMPFEAEYEYRRCVPFEKLKIEVVIYWQCLSEFLQLGMADEYDLILPELSIFCAYTEQFCKLRKHNMDKFEIMDFQYKLQSLLEILYKYDLGDEIGRNNLKKLFEFLLKNVPLNEKNFEVIIRCTENIITDQKERFQHLLDIASEICQLNQRQSNLLEDRTIVNEALANCSDSALKMKLANLKVKIMDLEEQENNLLLARKFALANKITAEKLAVTDEFKMLIEPLLASPLDIRNVKNEEISTGLQIIFHMIVSEKVEGITPQDCKIYKDFICRQMYSSTSSIRIWALKCGTAFSMHFDSIAKEVFSALYSQFYRHSLEKIWINSVTCMFEIIDIHGLEMFESAALEQTKIAAVSAVAAAAGSNTTSQRSGRLLYNNAFENLDLDEGDREAQQEYQQDNFLKLMSHFMDTLTTESIVNEIVLGFIRLILHGHINSGDIIEKLLLRYFNPTTNSTIQQYLSIFVEEMIRLRKQALLVPSLLPTINAVLSAPFDSPLLKVRPETITRFFIDITRQDPNSQKRGGGGGRYNLHNKIAQAFLNEISNNVNNRDMAKLLSKELLKLELNLSSDPSLKREMKATTDKLLTCELDAKAVKNLADFKDMLDGRFTRAAGAGDESEEEADDDTLTNDNQPRTSNTTPAIEATTTSNATTPAPSIIEEETDATLTEELPQPTANVAAEANTQTAEANESTTAAAAVASADESVASSMEQSSQQSLASPVCQVQNAKAIAIIQTPTITTFGHQNQVGQRCLRRSVNSLNNSRTHSESEASDTPRIRIELRIDSDKKKKPATTENSNAEPKRKNTQTSVSSRSLRMLSRQQKDATPQKNQASTSAELDSSSEELNNSEVVAPSPQASANGTARVFTVTRKRRGAAAAAIQNQASSPSARNTPRKSTEASLEKSNDAKKKQNTKSSATKATTKRLSSEDQTTTSTGKKTQTPASKKTPQKQVSKTASTKNMMPASDAEKTPTSAAKKTPTSAAKKTPTSAGQKTPAGQKISQQQTSKTVSTKNKTPTSAGERTPTLSTEKSPHQQESKTPPTSAAGNTSTSAANKTPRQQARNTARLQSTTPTTSSNLATLTQSEAQSDSSSSARITTSTATTKKTPIRLLRKAIYMSGTATLQRAGRKRVLPKVPLPNKQASNRALGASPNSESSSEHSPQPKQARRSTKSPKTRKPQPQKRLTEMEIISFLDGSDSDREGDTKSSSRSTSTAAAANKTKTPTKAQTPLIAKNNAAKSATRAKSLSASTSTPTRNTRNKAKETFGQQNIMTRKRKAKHFGGSGSGGATSSTSTTQNSPKRLALKRLSKGPPSRIPIASSQSSRATSTTTSRSSSSSPLRRGRPAAATTAGGFKLPRLRSESLGRSRQSRIPRKLP